VTRAIRERWNARYAEEGEPPRRRRSSCPSTRSCRAAGGRSTSRRLGRNALWLARRGLDVTLADVSDVALARAARAAATAASRSRRCGRSRDGAAAAGPWDLVVCTYFLHRPLLAALPAALAPGGLLVVAHATRTNLTRHARPGPDHVLEDGSSELIRGLEVLSSEEGCSRAAGTRAGRRAEAAAAP